MASKKKDTSENKTKSESISITQFVRLGKIHKGLNSWAKKKFANQTMTSKQWIEKMKQHNVVVKD